MSSVGSSQSGSGIVNSVDLPTGKLEVRIQSTQFPVDDLMGYAARANVKRGFLFVSKVLGKHWPVKPSTMEVIHDALAAKIPQNLPSPVVFIAMAETAVGLGQGMYEAYLRANPSNDAIFLHTTRYQVADLPIVEFEEAHSHAPRQFLHLPQNVAISSVFLNAQSLVLIDDEATTGNTFVNLAMAYRKINNNVKTIHLAAITNFMGEEITARLPERLGLDVTIGALLSGDFTFSPNNLQPAVSPAQLFERNAERGASGVFGRLGLVAPQSAPMELVRQLLAEVGVHEKVLVLGTGEFMHAAFILGRELEANFRDVAVQSTTRSPILESGAVRHSLSFADNYGEGISNYVYNVEPGQYDHIFICHETPLNAALIELAVHLDARLFHFHSEADVEENFIR